IVGSIARLAQRMENLTGALLDYSRVGRVDLAFQEVDLNVVLRDVLELLGPALDRSAAEVRIPRPLPSVRCDKARIGEVFQNLIVNGIKYNDKPTKCIEVGYLDGEAATFYVRDNGIGLRDEDRERVFRMFARLHAPDQFGA